MICPACQAPNDTPRHLPPLRAGPLRPHAGNRLAGRYEIAGVLGRGAWASSTWPATGSSTRPSPQGAADGDRRLGGGRAPLPLRDQAGPEDPAPQRVRDPRVRAEGRSAHRDGSTWRAPPSASSCGSGEGCRPRRPSTWPSRSPKASRPCTTPDHPPRPQATNVMLDQAGIVRLMDFGIAKAAPRGHDRHHRHRADVGTPST